ncbi:restriction endonuclease [Micromonospora parva]|uniref:restriction endonuclease n=1 Tax=Micromonospora parva TaxID=1464048 RepID=UPI00367175C9
MTTQPIGRKALSLDELLGAMDRVSANLERLQAIWDRASPMLPTGPSAGSTNEYDDLVRAWNDLLPGLPQIDGWTITEPLPDMDGIGRAYIDCFEIGEPPLAVHEAKEQPDKDLAEYQHRLNRARRRAVRERMQDLTTKVDTFLPQIMADANDRPGDERLDDPRVVEVEAAISEIERLMGDTAVRTGRWGDLHRHLHFGQPHDWRDICELDWPSVKPDIEAASFSEADPLPVPNVDLGLAAAQQPAGAASTALGWERLTPDNFEHLLHDLLRHLPGYQNAQLLMKANAADRGRDISVERVIHDGAGTVRTERVIVQAKHWLSRSVPPEDISSALTRISLWEPPVIRGLVVATSGHFTPDAVAWVEKHNEAGKVPLIDLWAESRLETLLSERPWLVAKYGLR